MLFLLFYLKYFAIGICTLITGLAAAAIIISTQRKATHSKGQIPKTDIQYCYPFQMRDSSLFSCFYFHCGTKCFCYTSYLSYRKNLSEKVSGYMTVPIYINNASLDKEAENGYLNFT